MIRTERFIRAYIQGDWVVAPASGGSLDDAINSKYQAFLLAADSFGVENTATWHIEAQGVHELPRTKNIRADVMRNTRQVDASDVVITYLQRADPPRKHWGAIAIMAYAVGRGKPVILLAPRECVVWANHFVHHPLVTQLPYTDHAQALLYLDNTLCGLQDV